MAQLLRDNDDVMRRYAYRLVGANDLDDVMQDAYLRAVRSHESFRGDSTFRTWLFRIVHNTAVDHIRRSQRRRKLETLDYPDPQSEARSGADELVDLEHLLGVLPLDQRSAITMVHVLGLSYDEAAAALDVPRGTVATRVHRGRALLHALLNEIERTPK